jgi:hypothetical protein
MGGGDEPGWVPDGRVVRQVRHDPGSPVDTTRWPATIPAVEQLLCEGLELSAGLTVLVGENGSGKSTLMEMLAEACGLNPQGGVSSGRAFPDPGQRAGPGQALDRGARAPPAALPGPELAVQWQAAGTW